MKKRKIVLYTLFSSFGLVTMFSCNGIKSEKIILKGDDAIELGETIELNAEVLPKVTSDKKVNWTSSDSSIAFVDNDGKVTGIKKGKATITATSNSNNRVKESIVINIGNYVSTHVTGLSITPVKTQLNEGEYSYIKPTIYPSNADNKKIRWVSEDPEYVSVYDNGAIKGENVTTSPIKIKAISEDGNIQAETSISVVASDKKNLIGFREPSCISNYNLKVKEAESIIKEANINRDNSASYINGNFYKNESEKLDTFKVGTKNGFKIKCRAAWRTSGFEDFTEDNPWQTIKITKQDGSSAEGLYELNNKQNVIQFKDSAINQIFNIEITPNNEKYNFDSSNPEFKKTFSVEVIDGYNAYNFADLTLIDNWNTTHAKEVLGTEHQIFKNNEFVDCWKEYKEINLPEAHRTANYKNIILQNDITIKNNDLPKYIKWTDKETDDYINGAKEPETQQRFNDYVEIKTNIHQDDWKSLPEAARRAKCRYILNGSQKDGTAIFNRIGEEPFALEGNYFTINASNIKPVAMFEQTTLDYYQKNATNVACLIDFGGFGDYHQKYHICSKQESIKELCYDEFRPFTPSISDAKYFTNKNEIKNVQIHGNSTRDVTHDEGMGGVNLTTCTVNCKFTNLLCHECSNAFYGQGSNENSLIDIERCKVFDMFSSFIRSYQQKTIKTKDSFFKDSGGVGVTLIEPVSDTRHPDTTMNIENTYMEAFVSGDEIFNKNNMGHYIIKILAAVGLGAWEQYKDLNFGGNPCDHRSIVKVEDGIPKINFLIFHNYSPFLQSIESGKTKVFGNNNKQIIDLSEGTIMDTYNQMDLTARRLLSMPIMSSEGGHGRIPFRQIAEANDLELYDENIPYETSTNQTYMLSYYKDHQTEINKSCPTYAQNAAKLFSGDYLTTYFSALGNYMSAFVLGYK